MIDQKKLSDFWDKDVPGKFKHWMSSDFNDKASKYESDITNHLIRQIDYSNIKTALDWGCGGGLGSFLLSEYCNVIALDIAKSSLDQCAQYMREHGKTLTSAYLLKNIEDLSIKESVDLIYSASVVQHFPSYEYWRSVVKYWRHLEPGWIALQTRHGEQNRSNEEEYFDDTKNYILGLYLTTEEVINSFSDTYELRYHKLIDDNYSMYEYFVFKNKNL